MGVDFFGGGGGDTFSSIKLDDTNASNYLTLDWNENDTVDRTLNLLVGGASRSITLSGSPTLGDWFDQSVKAAAAPSFASVNGLALTALTTGFSVAGGTTSKTLTVEDTSLINQDLTSDASPTHAALTLGSVSANGILNLYGLHANGYYHIIKGSNAEGLTGADLRIGLDETNRTLIICDRGDIDTDFGLAAMSYPTIVFISAAGSTISTMNYNNITFGAAAAIQVTTSTFTQKAHQFVFNLYDSDLGSTNFATFSSASNIELTDTDGRQAWLYVEPKINQSGTAAYDAIYVNSTNTALGTGATGDGNNLLNLSVSSVPKFLVNVNGSVTAGQVSVSLADNAVHDTGVTTFFGLLIVKDTTTGVSAVYRLDGATTPVAVSAHTNFSTTQGTDNKINVYFATTYKIENCNTAASVVRCAFIGC